MDALYRKNLIVTIFFTFVGLIYLHNITHDIYSGDIGDLVTAAYVFGVPHPPGYPLFTFLGFIASHLPLSWPPVAKVALVSAISSFIGLIFFYKISFKITKNLFIGLLSCSILAFSYLFWFHGEVPEVFGLNNFFTIVILYLSLMFYFDKKMKYLFLTFFFCGLALTHHQTIIFLFPAVLILVTKHLNLILSKKTNILYILIAGLAGFLPYIYPLIAASTHPVVNWDNPHTLVNLFHLIFRKDYSYISNTSSIGQTGSILLNNYFKTIISTFSYQVMFIIVMGAIYLGIKNRRILGALTISYIISGPLLVLYINALATSSAEWGVVERFYVMSSVILMFFVPFGFLFMKEFLEKFFVNKIFATVLIGYFIIVPVLSFVYNFPKTDLSTTHIGDTLAADILKPLTPHAVLHLYGDTTTFNVWYYHYVLKQRADVDLIHPPGPGGNTYFDQEINTYYRKNPNAPMQQLPSLTLEEIRKRRPVYASYQIQYVPKDSLLIPKGLVYELIYKKDLPDKSTYLAESRSFWKSIQPPTLDTLKPNEENLIAQEIPTLYSNGLLNTGNFLILQYKDINEAISYYKKATVVDSTNSGAWVSLGISQIQAYKKCSEGIENMKNGIALYPLIRKYYLQLYTGYKWCGQVKEMRTVEIYYKKTFRKELINDLKSI